MEDRLKDLFKAFQSLVELRAIEGKHLSRTQEFTPDVDPLPIEHWIADLFRIERSPEFNRVAQEFSAYRDECITNENANLRNLLPGVKCLFHGSLDNCDAGSSNQFWRDIEVDDHYECAVISAFGLWCRASGFYYAKYVLLDLADWSPRFDSVLKRMPGELGQIKVSLLVGRLSDHCVPSQSGFVVEKLSAAEVLSHHYLNKSIDALYMTGFVSHLLRGLDRFNVNIELTAITKSITYDHALKGRESALNLVENERLTLQLCASIKKRFEFVVACSSTLLEPVFFGHAFPQPTDSSEKDERRRDADLLSDKLATENFLAMLDGNIDTGRQFKVKSLAPADERHWHRPLFDLLVSLLREGTIKNMGLVSSLLFFDKANLATEQTIEFLMYVVCLESLLSGGRSDNIGERIAKRHSRMSASSGADEEVQRQLIKDIYERRNAIVHGKNPDIVVAPFVGIMTSHQIRSICRQALITIIFALDRLRLDKLSTRKTELYRFFTSRNLDIPMNRDKLCSYMGEFEDNQEFWASFHATVNAYAAGLGYPIDVFFNKDV